MASSVDRTRADFDRIAALLALSCGRLVQTIFFMAVFASASAEDDPLLLYTTPADECGDPRTISQIYEVAWGVVADVTSGDTIVIRRTPRFPSLPVFMQFDHVHSKTVRLVDIDAPYDSEALALSARAELSRLGEAGGMARMIPRT